jgi:hypothetical protein
MTADLTSERLTGWVHAGETELIAAALITAPEPARRALAMPLRQFRADSLNDRSDPLGDNDLPFHEAYRMRRQITTRRHNAFRVAGAGTMTGVAKVVSWLRLFGFADSSDPRVADALIRVLSAPGRPSLAAVARGLAARMRPAEVRAQWPLVTRLLEAAGEPAPATEAVLRGWLAETHCSAVSLRADPRTPLLLPHLFTIERLGGEVAPGGLAGLTEHRAVILPGCVSRLAAGDRPGAIRAFVELHRLLEPSLDELSEHRQSYLAMLSSPHGTVADVGLRSLRAVDDAGLLEVEAVADAAYAVLGRREKKLVRAQLDWLAAALVRKPDPALFEALLTGLSNEAVDLAERALRLAAKHLPAFGPPAREQLAQAGEGLTGDLCRQVRALLPAAEQTGAPRTPVLIAADGPAAPMPDPIRSVPEVVAAAVALTGQVAPDPVRLELVLDGLVRFAHADPEGLAAALVPKVPQWSDPLAGLLRAAAHRSWSPWTPDRWQRHAAPPFWMLTGRLSELSEQLTGTPPPALLATPATVDGHVDPERVLTVLTSAEADGWQPGPYDLSQAMLRLPRTVDPVVLAAAERLTSPAGRLFAAWLRGGGLPDPAVVTLDAVWHRCPDATACTCQWPPTVRRTSAFPEIPRPAPITVPAWLLALPAEPDHTRGRRSDHPLTGWPMILPGHPEIVAAHALPEIITAADDYNRQHLDILPVLAAATGPFGPAMALCLAHAFSADRTAGRVSATDAFVELAARGKLDGALVGRELAHLQRDGRLVLKRVAGCLTEALRAGVTTQTWAAARELVPAALATPGAGTPDLLAAAEAAAAAVQASDDLPEVTEVAARPGRSRLVTEAARLARTLAANRERVSSAAPAGLSA